VIDREEKVLTNFDYVFYNRIYLVVRRVLALKRYLRRWTFLAIFVTCGVPFPTGFLLTCACNGNGAGIDSCQSRHIHAFVCVN